MEVEITRSSTAESRVTRLPDGRTTTRSSDRSGSTLVHPDGTVIETLETADPRLGPGVSLIAERLETLPSGLTRETAETRSVEEDDDGTLLVDTRTRYVGGSYTTSVWRRDARERTVTSDEGRTMVTVEDLNGHPVELRVGDLASVRLSYDADGRVVEVRQGSGADERVVFVAYGSDGRLETITDAGDRVTTLVRNPVGRVLQAALPGSRTLTLTYDQNGNLASVTPPGRPAHEMSYTLTNLLQTETAPPAGGSARVTSHEYDRDKKPTVRTLPSGRTVTTTYDTAGRPATMTFDADSITLSYHPIHGQLVSLDSASGVDVSYSWDGPLRTGTAFSGAVSGSLETYFYQGDFRPYDLGMNGVLDVTVNRDGDGLIEETDVLYLSRDPTHGAVSQAAAGVVETDILRNGFGEVTSSTTAGLLSVQHVRDGFGRIIEQSEMRGAASTIARYSYDSAGRLTVEDVDGVVRSHSYDENGNRLTAGDMSCTFDDRDRLVECTNLGVTTSYGTNDDGQVTSKDVDGAVTSYQMDARGALRRVVLPDGTEVEYVIDAVGRRVGKKIDGALVRQWLWSDGLRIAAELDGSGALVSRFVYATRPNVPDLVIRGGTTYRVIHDHLGSPLFVVDVNDGTVMQERRFDAWGNRLLDTNPGLLPFGFAGGHEDLDTGLVRFGARDYDPETGRWASADPIGFAGGDPNLYGYVLGDPVNRFDPSGLYLGESLISELLAWLEARAAISAAQAAGAGGGAAGVGGAGAAAAVTGLGAATAMYVAYCMDNPGDVGCACGSAGAVADIQACMFRRVEEEVCEDEDPTCYLSSTTENICRYDWGDPACSGCRVARGPLGCPFEIKLSQCTVVPVR